MRSKSESFLAIGLPVALLQQFWFIAVPQSRVARKPHFFAYLLRTVRRCFLTD